MVGSEGILGACENCGTSYLAWEDIVLWGDAASTDVPQSSLSQRSLLEKFRSAIDDGALIERLLCKSRQMVDMLRPYQLLTGHLQSKAVRLRECYYEAILVPNSISNIWYDRYIKDLDIAHGSTAFEIGCGRGANLCHLLNGGFRVFGQDIYRDSWWGRISNAKCQVVPAGYRYLPWPSESFDLILSKQVAAFFSVEQWQDLARELFRVLKPSGVMVMQETNPGSPAISHHRRYYGRDPHELEAARGIFSSHFEEIDSWYEGYYARHFPMIDNLLYTARHDTIGPWMVADERDQLLEPESRGCWVARFRKV